MADSNQDIWLSALGVDVDKLRNAANSAPSLGSLVDSAVASGVNAMAGNEQSLVDSAPLPQGMKDAAASAISLQKGVYEGLYEGVKGAASGVQSAVDMMSGVAVAKGMTEVAEAAVSANARKELETDVTNDVNKVVAAGNMAANPLGTLLNAAVAVKDGYDKAGDKTEFVGKGIGLATAVAATAALGGGAEEAESVLTEEAPGLGQAVGPEAPPEIPSPASEIPPTEMPATEMPPTEPGAPPTIRTPGPEPFEPAPSAYPPPPSPEAYSIPPPPISPAAESVVPSPISPAAESVVPQPISPAAYSVVPGTPIVEVPGAPALEEEMAPATVSSPGPEPFEPAPSAVPPAPPPEAGEDAPREEEADA